jgi:hypothetical protein
VKTVQVRKFIQSREEAINTLKDAS